MFHKTLKIEKKMKLYTDSHTVTPKTMLISVTKNVLLDLHQEIHVLSFSSLFIANEKSGIMKYGGFGVFCFFTMIVI